MGLFSSKHKYYAYAASSTLFEEDERPETVKSLILQSAVGAASPSEAVIMGLQTDMYARSRSMVRYGLKKYVRGLPETDQVNITVPDAAIQDAIEDAIGEPVSELVTVYSGPIREKFFIAWHLQINYDNPAHFNWPAGPPLTPIWDEYNDLVEIPVENPDAIVPPDSPYYITDNAPDFQRIGTTTDYSVSFAYTDNLGDPQVWDMDGVFDLSPWLGIDLIQVRFRTAAAPDTTRYFIYEIGSGVNPDLEEAISSETINAEYLPVAILMHDKVWFDEPPDTELEATTNTLLRRLVLNGTEVKEDYLEQKEKDIEEGNTEPSTAEEWDFFIQFAVPIHTRFRGAREYIYHFLKFLETTQTSTFDDYQAYLANGGAQPVSDLKITEGDVNGYNVEYGWSYVYSVTKPGRYTIPPDPKHPTSPEAGTQLKRNRMYSQLYENGSFIGDTSYIAGLTEVHGEGILYGSPLDEDGYHDYVIFTRQHKDIDTEEWSYTQVLMMAPSMQYVINTSEDVSDYRFRYAEPELFPEDPELESEFRFPIHIASLKETAVMHREEALSDALCATVFLVQDVKIKWYQKTFFKWLIVIIVIIIVILTYQYELIPAIAAWAAGAVGGSLLVFYMVYAVLMFAIGFLISFAGALIGGRLGTLFVIVATLYLMGGNPFVGMQNSWATLASSPTWGSAFAFINAVAPFANFAMTVYQDISLAKLESDLRDFEKTAREKYQELEDAWYALGPPPDWLDPMDLIFAQNTTVIESPEGFFARSLNANPGILGYDLINNFTEIALGLPEDVGEGNVLEKMFEDFERQRGAA